MTSDQYAGFWLRFVAFIIDGILIGIIQTIIIVPALGAVGISLASGDFNPETMSEAESISMAMSIIGTIGTSILISQVVYILYFTIMEASKYQATLGKMALGLKVTDLEGKNLDFVKSLLRNIGKIVSQFILYIGFIMAGLTEKKQALHDMMAGALVVKK